MSKIYQKTTLGRKNRTAGRFGGFTLIELLVVVLIIGILSAIAWPKYETAVLKSRLGGSLPTLKALKEQAEDYYMANGRYATNTAQDMMIDIQMPGCVNAGNATLKCDDNVYYDVHTAAALNGSFDVAVLLIDGNKDIRLAYGMMLAQASGYPNRNWCGAKPGDKPAQSICKGMGGTFVKTGFCTHTNFGGSHDCDIYLLPG